MKSVSQSSPFGLSSEACLDFRISSFGGMAGSKCGKREDNCIPPSPSCLNIPFHDCLQNYYFLWRAACFSCLRCNDPCVGLYKLRRLAEFLVFAFVFGFSFCFVLLTAWGHFLISERSFCLFLTGGLWLYMQPMLEDCPWGAGLIWCWDAKESKPCPLG